MAWLTTPTARRNDPPTAQAAATAASRQANETEAAILEVLRTGSRTTDEVAEVLKKHPPSVGTAISRLAKRGLVIPIGERLSARGRTASVWQALEQTADPHASSARSARRLPRELKVADLLCDGRVRILRRDDLAVVAKVRGHHGDYDVTCDAAGWWTCSCRAGARRCTHAQAVRLVVGIGCR